MVTVCYAAKGGQGCTTIAATLALLSAPATIIDLTGDVPAVLGVPEPSGPGVADLLAGGRPLTRDDLDRCAIPVATGVRLVPRGDGGMDSRSERWEDLAALLVIEVAGRVYVDAGVDSPLVEHVPRRLLVTRHCYLALRRARLGGIRPSGIVTLREPGRVLNATDVERVFDVPVLATVEVAAEMARVIDAGLLASGRLPSHVERALRRLQGQTPPPI